MSGFPIGGVPPQTGLTSTTQPVKTGDASEVAGLSRAELERLKQATADFEGMFVKQLLSVMRKTIPKDKDGGLFGESQGEKMFKDLLDGEYAKVMSSRANGIGLKEAMIKQLTASMGRRQAGSGVDLETLRAERNPSSVAAPAPIGKENGLSGGGHDG